MNRRWRLSSNSKNGSVEWSYQPASSNQSASLWQLPPRVTLTLIVRVVSRHGGCEISSRQRRWIAYCWALIANTVLKKPAWEYSIKGNCSVDLTLEGDSKPAFKNERRWIYGRFAVTLYSAEVKGGVPNSIVSMVRQEKPFLCFSLRINSQVKQCINVSRWRLRGLR